MTQEEINKTVDDAVEQASSPRRRKRLREDDRFFAIRNVLNVIFMLGALVGVAFYLMKSDSNVGIIIIMASMAFKVVECCLRFIR